MFFVFLTLDFIYLFLERGEGREKEREKDIDVWEKHGLVAFHMPPTGDLAHNPDMCPDLESNLQPFSLQDNIQPTKPYQSGLALVFKNKYIKI